MTVSYSCDVNRTHATAEQLFEFASEQLTWRAIRDNIPIASDDWWTVARSGPFLLRAQAVLDQDANLDEWTSRDEAPDLYAKLDRGDLAHIGLIVEISAHGNLLGHASLWSVILDLSSTATEEDSYRSILLNIRDLISEAAASLPMQMERTISDLQHAALVLNGIEAPYHRSICF